jgi:hypothetical protein
MLKVYTKRKGSVKLITDDYDIKLVMPDVVMFLRKEYKGIKYSSADGIGILTVPVLSGPKWASVIAQQDAIADIEMAISRSLKLSRQP